MLAARGGTPTGLSAPLAAPLEPLLLVAPLLVAPSRYRHVRRPAAQAPGARSVAGRGVVAAARRSVAGAQHRRWPAPPAMMQRARRALSAAPFDLARLDQDLAQRLVRRPACISASGLAPRLALAWSGLEVGVGVPRSEGPKFEVQHVAVPEFSVAASRSASQLRDRAHLVPPVDAAPRAAQRAPAAVARFAPALFAAAQAYALRRPAVGAGPVAGAAAGAAAVVAAVAGLLTGPEGSLAKLPRSRQLLSPHVQAGGIDETAKSCARPQTKVR